MIQIFGCHMLTIKAEPHHSELWATRPNKIDFQSSGQIYENIPRSHGGFEDETESLWSGQMFRNL